MKTAYWCRARHSWTHSPGGGVMAECAPDPRAAPRGAALHALDWALQRLGLGAPRPERESREVIGSRFTVYKYWTGPASRPLVEARAVADSDGRLIWAGAVLPGRGEHGFEALEGGAPGWEPLFPEPPGLEPPPAPAGQKWVRRPVVYAAEGRVAPGDPVVELGYYSEAGAEAVARLDVRGLGAEAVEADFNCVTGWSVARVAWRGVPVEGLLRDHGLRGRWLLAVSAGGYATIIPLSWGLARATYLVTGLGDGSPLPIDHGWPARLVSPPLYGWKYAKWLRGLYVGDSYLDGFWEARGYHWRGLVALEERFKDLGVTRGG